MRGNVQAWVKRLTKFIFSRPVYEDRHREMTSPRVRCRAERERYELRRLGRRGKLTRQSFLHTQYKGPMADTCLQCGIPLLEDRTILQCWRTDTPADTPTNDLAEKYCEVLSMCVPCADDIERQIQASQSVMVIPYKGYHYLIDRMLDLKKKKVTFRKTVIEDTCT